MSNLTSHQLNTLKKSLFTRESCVQSQVQGYLAQRVDGSYIELKADIKDEGDASVVDTLIDFDNSMAEYRVEELRAIDIAKNRLLEGCYGECIDCGEDISYKRLAVHPIAKRCIRCQSVHERTYAGRRVASL